MPRTLLTTLADLKGAVVGDLPGRGATLCGGKTAIVAGDRRLSYSELEEGAREFGVGLHRLGVHPGDRVAIALPNTPELAIAYYGAARMGVVPAWVNPRYRREEIAQILRIARPRGAIVPGGEEGPTRDLLDCKADCPSLEWVISVQGGGETVGFREVREGGQALDAPAFQLHPLRDLAMLVHSSGSTGAPKGVPVTHEQAIRQAFAYVGALEITSEDVFLAALPLCHSYAAISILIEAIAVQGTVVMMDRFDAGQALRLMQTERVTIHHGVPAHFILEMDHPDFGSTDLSRLRAGLCSGYVPPIGLLERTEKAMGIYLSHFWGSTETGPGLLPPFGSPPEVRHETVGRPLDGCQVRVVEPDTENEVPRGEAGELLYRGWTVTSGYWEDPAETARHITGDGFFRTGDLGSVDKNGWVRIVGRVKDQINRGALKIVPSEVERLILRDRRVREAAVVGLPDPVLGEKSCACLVLEPGETITLDEIRDVLAKEVASFKIPDFLLILDSLPKVSGSVKIKRTGPGGLAEAAAALLGEQGA